MPLLKKVKDIMIPLEHYAVIGPNETLFAAILSLRHSYCQVETNFCTEAGPRTILVINASGELVGILDFQSILKVLVPEVAGKLSAKLMALEVSVVFAEAGAERLDIAREDIAARIRRNAEVPVRAIMRKNKGHIEADAELMEALKLIFRKKITMLPVFDQKRVVGVVRYVDLFLAVADMVRK